MGQKNTYWQIVGFVFTAFVGTLLHFLFDWAGGNVCIALFSAVNESIWEHLKLLFYPMLLFAIVEYFCYGKHLTNFWCIKQIGIQTGLLLIPILYYTYTGIFGINADWLNICIFFLVGATVYYLETKCFQRHFASPLNPIWTFLVMGILVLLFTVFTFRPPHIPLFQDPTTGSFGFQHQ